MSVQLPTRSRTYHLGSVFIGWLSSDPFIADTHDGDQLSKDLGVQGRIAVDEVPQVGDVE